jgi:hypothetical protein
VIGADVAAALGYKVGDRVSPNVLLERMNNDGSDEHAADNHGGKRPLHLAADAG